eukprot:NODE_2771_length_506_cov_124.242744_g2721_i0.p1 GENE.NODE_2771_length_506_cov_124.242744_g2721_i0~~NODE_2771_length_506_cov_124.242744_g2721_i0.p1  ORF type:complete len:109 (-),score=28.45 NODE_2771_length_506_cov_124.242744_g2721_i0:112-438(-)
MMRSPLRTVARVARKMPQQSAALQVRGAAQTIEVTLINLNHIGAGVSASGSGMAAPGIGLVWLGLQTGSARQPNMADQFFAWAMVGFAFCEAAGLLSLMVAMLLLFAV